MCQNSEYGKVLIMAGFSICERYTASWRCLHLPWQSSEYILGSKYIRILNMAEFFLVRIFPHSGWIRRDSPYLSVFSPNAENTDQKNLRIWTLFTQCLYTYFFYKKPAYKKLEAGAPSKLRNFHYWFFWSTKN